jgi:hypothetical protein
MEAKGLDESAIIQELIAVEADAFRMAAEDNDTDSGD